MKLSEKLIERIIDAAQGLYKEFREYKLRSALTELDLVLNPNSPGELIEPEQPISTNKIGYCPRCGYELNNQTATLTLYGLVRCSNCNYCVPYGVLQDATLS